MFAQALQQRLWSNFFKSLRGETLFAAFFLFATREVSCKETSVELAKPIPFAPTWSKGKAGF